MLIESTTAALPLPAHGQVQVWLLEEAALNEVSTALFVPWLSDDERVRWQRFRASDDRQRFLLARALLRSVLARYCRCEPVALQFASDEHGKPFLVTHDVRLQSLRFNLSHTRGMCALAVAKGMEVGVDVENQIRDVDMLALAARFFAPQEVVQLEALPAASLRAGFFRLWTLKEAYVKARGLGLKLGLASFGFDLAAENPRLQFAADDDAARWSFACCKPADHLHVAVATPDARAQVNFDRVTWLA